MLVVGWEHLHTLRHAPVVDTNERHVTDDLRAVDVALTSSVDVGRVGHRCFVVVFRLIERKPRPVESHISHATCPTTERYDVTRINITKSQDKHLLLMRTEVIVGSLSCHFR